jgi:outer membrane immunogenic protein
MKKIFAITAALAASAAATPAIAADLAPRYSQPEPAYIAYPPLYNWTGFYVGGHLGGAFSGNNNFLAPFAHSNSNGRFLGGVQVGADYLFAPNWLVGVEGQYSWLSGRMGAVFPDGIAYTNGQSGLGSMTGRFGYSWGPGLVYVKGGYAYSSNNERLTFSNLPVAFAIAGDHHNGWTVGAGLEFMLAPNWSGKIEYQYYNFGKETFITPAIGNFTTDDSTVKLGVNYRFNWGVPFAVRY